MLVYLRAPWPDDVTSMFAVLSFANFGDRLLGLSCLGLPESAAVYMPFLWPLLLQPLVLACAAVMVFWRSYNARKNWLHGVSVNREDGFSKSVFANIASMVSSED